MEAVAVVSQDEVVQKVWEKVWNMLNWNGALSAYSDCTVSVWANKQAHYLQADRTHSDSRPKWICDSSWKNNICLFFKVLKNYSQLFGLNLIANFLNQILAFQYIHFMNRHMKLLFVLK